MVAAISDLTEEALNVIEEVEEESSNHSNKKDLFLQQTNIVLKTVDPMKINQAVGALYTTWLGVSAILKQEYARVINLSLALAAGIDRVANFILGIPIRSITPEDYEKWPPVIIGWVSKGIAMKVAWRIQRVLTASTSAIAGGTMFAQSIIRMIRNKKNKKNHKGRKRKKEYEIKEYEEEEDEYENHVASLLENSIAVIVGGIGLYTQLDYQSKNNFSFEVPFPINLITWPFDVAERWVQWYITEK